MSCMIYALMCLTTLMLACELVVSTDSLNLVVFALRKADSDPRSGADGQTAPAAKVPSPRSSTSIVKPHLWAILDGLRLIFSSNYLLSVSLFLWLSAVVSSFFYFQVKQPLSLNMFYQPLACIDFILYLKLNGAHPFLQLQKVTVIAMTVSSSLGRRRLLAEINSFIAVFILAGQLTLTVCCL